MRYHVLALVAAAAVTLAACQQKPPAPAADPAEQAAVARWSALAKLPDWTGVWEVDWRNERKSPRPAPMKLTPKYQAMLDEYHKKQAKGENLQSEGANCVPPGLPGIMTQPYPVQFLYQPEKVVMLIEPYMQFRQVYTDGRALPEDPDPSFNGHSVGHWDGDTLVVDSVGFVPNSKLAPGVGHSEQLKITERIHRVDHDWLEIQTTLTDPEVLAEPYTSTTSYKHLDDEIREYICLENNRDAADSKGRPSMHLE